MAMFPFPFSQARMVDRFAGLARHSLVRAATGGAVT